MRPHHNAETLYFKNHKTIEGNYHKDFTTSPKANGGFETATFTSAVDLQDTFIAINWFGGEMPKGVTGEIRLAIGKKTYGLPFHIKTQRGNSSLGRDKTLTSGRPANQNWLVIPAKAILRLK